MLFNANNVAGFSWENAIKLLLGEPLHLHVNIRANVILKQIYKVNPEVIEKKLKFLLGKKLYE